MRALVFLASLAIAGPSLAQPQLLVEMRNTMMICADCQPIDMRIDFAGWSQRITTADVGQTFYMPMDVLDDFSQLLTNPDSRFDLSFQLFSVGPGGPAQTGYVPWGIFNTGSLTNNPQVIRHAPPLGLNLSGYAITSVSQTLDTLDVIQQSSSRFRLDAVSFTVQSRVAAHK